MALEVAIRYKPTEAIACSTKKQISPLPLVTTTDEFVAAHLEDCDAEYEDDREAEEAGKLVEFVSLS
ncbi:hypothetical protein GcM3_216022 [Golovinomyces cichoracearum]|uniref:Uncharacterized protein n=1 Tax=Golovinomyces cichoracearum TaxID=62708 RepID=A0A420H8G6_9PEZI|nr:hypothetical protein GcM3_216022 [Golovinomyces cichoracearum]